MPTLKRAPSTFNITLNEEELKIAVAYYIKGVYHQDIKVKHIKHLVGKRTEGHGCMEMDLPYQDGLEIIAEDL